MLSNKFFLDQITEITDVLTSTVFEGSEVCNKLFFDNVDTLVSGTNLTQARESETTLVDKQAALQNEQVKNLRLSSRVAILEGKLVDAKNESIKTKMQAIAFESEIKELDRKLRHNQIEQGVQAKLRQQLHAREIEVVELKAESVLLRKRLSALETQTLVNAERARAERIAKTLITKEEANKARKRVEQQVAVNSVESKQEAVEVKSDAQDRTSSKKSVAQKENKKQTISKKAKTKKKATKQNVHKSKVDAQVTEKVGAESGAETVTSKTVAKPPELRKLDKQQDIAVDPVPIHKEDFARLKNVTRLTTLKNDK